MPERRCQLLGAAEGAVSQHYFTAKGEQRQDHAARSTARSHQQHAIIWPNQPLAFKIRQQTYTVGVIPQQLSIGQYL
ncbi:hypothetical protein D3C80_1834020 [compost metagenome]